MQKIHPTNFHTWKADPVTQVVLDKVTTLINHLNSALTDETVLMGDQKQIARLLGNKEALEVVLAIKYEDLVDEEKIESD